MVAALWAGQLGWGQDSGAEAGRQFRQLCGGCHGESAKGTDKGPALVDNRKLRNRSESQIAEVIQAGTQGGMPGFPLANDQLEALARWVRVRNASAYSVQPAGDTARGEAFFFGAGGCGGCHMVGGRGKANGPDLSEIGKQLTVGDLEETLDNPSARGGNRSSASCPGWAWCPQNPWEVVVVKRKGGGTVRGYARSRGPHDLQLQGFDGRFHLLQEGEWESIEKGAGPAMPALRATAEERRDLLAYLSRLGGIAVGPARSGTPVSEAEIARVMQPKEGEWPTYNGTLGGNRHSALKQIDVGNVGRMQPAWSYTLPYFGLETTPLVADGVMYVSGPNQVCALDARTGREIWCYARPRTPAGGIAGDAAKGAQRGVALAGERIFFATDNAHLLCLNRLTGGLMWEVVVPEKPGRYGSTAAPLVVGDLVVTGVAGGDEGIRGFLAAFKVTTGELAWRFWTVPRPGEAASETWKGKAIEVGGGATWLTGSYDAETGLLYWTTGNPFPDTDGEERGGDNLYTNCVVALEAKTGKLRWHFQFTPHDLHDWDATEPVLAVNARFRGEERKLLLQANRNGFYYVLDRTNGQFLLGTPFVKKLTWASGIGKDGRPVLVEGNQPTRMGTKACPAVRGATNWYSTAYHPGTRLFYVMAVEDCNIYQQSALGGYVPYQDPKDPPLKVLRALDMETGKVAWEIVQTGAPEANYSGVLTTAGGLLFYGETGGGFAAVDAKTGKTLWHFETGQIWKASPMTYLMNGKQYVAIAAGANIVAFAVGGR